MKSVILYAYPPEPDGLSIQGHLLYRGMKENGETVIPCHFHGGLQKEWSYKSFRPDVSIGIGFWGNTPELILEPQKFGVQPVPWLVADGWVANYHDILSSLPLVLTTSSWVKKTYERDGVDIKNFEVAHIGFDPELFHPIPKSDRRVQKVREILGVKKEEKMILTVGGDVTSKGAQEIFQALAKVETNFPNWKYVCKSWGSDCSRGHNREERALIKGLGLDKNKILHFEGSFSREFMPYLLNACDVYAAPSRLEGFGLIQLEAQACGIPVVSINAMGPQEVVVHEKTGFLAAVAETIDLESEWVYPEMGFKKKMVIQFDKPKTFAYRANIDDLAKYLLELLTDEKRYAQMSANAVLHTKKEFDYRVIAKKITNLIKERLRLN
jgi:alpha-maltose-1-phosphate synthase